MYHVLSGWPWCRESESPCVIFSEKRMLTWRTTQKLEASNQQAKNMFPLHFSKRSDADIIKNVMLFRFASTLPALQDDQLPKTSWLQRARNRRTKIMLERSCSDVLGNPDKRIFNNDLSPNVDVICGTETSSLICSRHDAKIVHNSLSVGTADYDESDRRNRPSKAFFRIILLILMKQTRKSVRSRRWIQIMAFVTWLPTNNFFTGDTYS